MEIVLNARRFCVLLIFISILLFAPATSYAAEIQFAPVSGTFPADTPFSVKIVVVPASGEKVNAADGTIQYNQDVLEVTGISKDGSSFSLWTAEPSFSNSNGSIIFSGGTPTAFSSQGTVLTVTFKGKVPGNGKMTVTKGSILAADGKGTDVYKGANEGTITITAAAPVAAPPEEEGDGAGVTPPAPSISSNSFPKAENWYSTTTGQFAWKLMADVVGVRMLVSGNENDVPNKALAGTATSTVVTGLDEGISYFLLQFRNSSGWGEIGKRMIQIDSTPPKEFDFSVIQGDPPKFRMEAVDELSGVDRYDVLIGSTTASIRVSDMVDNMMPIPPQPGGTQTVTVRAFDKAGNVRDVTKALPLPEVLKASKAAGDEVPVATGGGLLERILAISFAFIIGIIGTMNYRLKKQQAADKAMILGEIAVIRDKNDKIFSAMREEFEQMVNDFDEKPQLTPQERDLLEKMKEVLEVSEELLDTNMEELKKMIRGD